MKTSPLFLIVVSILVIITLLFRMTAKNSDSKKKLQTNHSSIKNSKFRKKTTLYRKNLEFTDSNPDETLRQKVKAIYDSQLGVREATRHNDGPQVEAYLRYTGLGKGYAWCAAFVCWVLGQAGVENPKTAWAASLFPNDKRIWPRAETRTSGNAQPTMKKATIFGLYFPSLKRIAHCGFIDQWGDKEAITVEGNTNDTGSREGDGVYRKRRPIKSLHALADWMGRAGQ